MKFWKRVTGRRKPTLYKQRVIYFPKRVNIQVGLDLGTSSAKVVYWQFGRRIRRPVLFDHAFQHYPKYCLPSVVAIDDNGDLVFGIEAEKLLINEPWNSGIRRFKVLVAGKYDNSFRDRETEMEFNDYTRRHSKNHLLSPELVTAMYLAYVMHQTREFIEKTPEYSQNKVDLTYNVNIPIEHLEKEEVRVAFEKILAWAEVIESEWLKSKEPFDIVKAAEKLEKKANYDRKERKSFERKNPRAKIFTVPEAVAEAQSYLQSLQKKEGIHVIIDFGAGTTDASIFNYNREETYWYAANCFPRGTINIERIIAAHLRKLSCDKPYFSSIDIFHYLQGMKSRNLTNYIEKEDILVLNKKIYDELEELWETTRQTWKKAYRDHLRGESKWDNVIIFACGGGSKLPSIEEIFSEPWWEQLRTWNIKYPVKELPIPDDYDSLGGQVPFNRMSVAYGLSFPIPEFGDFTLPADSPDQTPVKIMRSSPEWEGKPDPRGWV